MKETIIYILSLYIGFFTPLLLMIYLARKKLGITKYNKKYIEIINLMVPKGTKEKLKAYALIKGFKDENEFINHLIKEELQKDNEKLNN